MGYPVIVFVRKYLPVILVLAVGMTFILWAGSHIPLV